MKGVAVEVVADAVCVVLFIGCCFLFPMSCVKLDRK